LVIQASEIKRFQPFLRILKISFQLFNINELIWK